MSMSLIDATRPVLWNRAVMRGGRGPWWSRTRTLGIGLGVVVVLGVIAQIVNANVLTTPGDPTRYGQIAVPGSEVLRLPSASFEGILEDPLEEKPKITAALRLSIKPLEGGPAPEISRDVGESFGTSNGNFGPDTYYRRVWRIDVPRAGRFQVSVGGAGPDPGYFLDLGNSPPVGSATIWLWTGIAAAGLLALWLLGRAVAYLRRA
jgi:hypothetical protein